MKNGLFAHPVYAANGRYLVEEINSVEEAIHYVERRTFDQDDLIASVTWRALSKCLEGGLPVGAARQTFFRMLKKKGLLVEREAVLMASGDLRSQYNHLA